MSDTFKRPTLSDPEEYDLIKSIHFKEPNRYLEDLDPIEKLERMDSRQRNKNKKFR